MPRRVDTDRVRDAASEARTRASEAVEHDFSVVRNRAIHARCDEYLARLAATRVWEIGMSRSTLRAVLAAMCCRMRLAGSEVFYVAVRDLAIDAHISPTTAQNALTRLRLAGANSWAVYQGTHDEHGTGMWRLNFDRLAETDPESLCQTLSVCLGAERQIAAAATGSSLHDAWSAKALGKSAQAVLVYLLQAPEDQKVAKVAQGIGFAHNTVKAALQRLQEAGMVEVEGKCWRVVDNAGKTELDRAARVAGTVGKTKWKQKNIEDERETWAKRKTGATGEGHLPTDSLRIDLDR